MHLIIFKPPFVANRLSNLIVCCHHHRFVFILVAEYVNEGIFTVKEDAISVFLIILPFAVIKIVGLVAPETSFALFLPLCHTPRELDMHGVHRLDHATNVLVAFFRELFKSSSISPIFNVGHIVIFILGLNLNQMRSIVVDILKLFVNILLDLGRSQGNLHF